MDIRRRVPFKLNKDEDEDENVVLDEQEQDELIQKLKDEVNQSNRWYETGVVGILALSGLLHLIFLANPSDDPLEALFLNSATNFSPGIPVPRVFTLFNLLLHLNLLILLNPGSLPFVSSITQQAQRLMDRLPLPLSIPISFNHSYSLSLVAPAISLFLRTSYTTVLWWCETIVVAYVVQAIKEAITTGDIEVDKLEGLKYRALGA